MSLVVKKGGGKMVKLEYQIIRKIFYEDKGVLSIDLEYFIDNVRYTTGFNVSGSMVNEWESELSKLLKKIKNDIETKEVKKTIIDGIKINEKKEFK
jgi:hypothetical protein